MASRSCSLGGPRENNNGRALARRVVGLAAVQRRKWTVLFVGLSPLRIGRCSDALPAELWAIRAVCKCQKNSPPHAALTPVSVDYYYLYISVLQLKTVRSGHCMMCKACSLCHVNDDLDQDQQPISETLFCDKCDRGYHCHCLQPPLLEPPEVFVCPRCQLQSPQRQPSSRDIRRPNKRKTSPSSTQRNPINPIHTANPMHLHPVPTSSKHRPYESYRPADLHHAAKSKPTRSQTMLHVPQNPSHPSLYSSVSAYTPAQKGKGKQMGQQSATPQPQPYAGLLSAKQAAPGPRIPLTDDRRLWELAKKKADVRPV